MRGVPALAMVLGGCAVVVCLGSAMDINVCAPHLVHVANALCGSWLTCVRVLCVCVHVCAVRVFLCVCVYVCMRACVCACVCMCVLCVCFCVSVCMYACEPVCLRACVPALHCLCVSAPLCVTAPLCVCLTQHPAPRSGDRLRVCHGGGSAYSH
jgi:hypothetical protein